ncbi:hypothetical protein [Oleiharenicola lentus]|uniref:hypothetical protein n=1 Tax=Oleiharenicola lentus TaxID=2508720 RepID=UPI003F670237
MKSRILLAALLIVSLSPLARAADVADLARAQVVFAKVMKITESYQKVSGVVGAANATPAAIRMPVATANKTGKFYLPFAENGELAAWAEKAISAHVGAAVGSKVGEKAGAAVASKVPIPFAGSLLAGGIKKKSKEIGAMTAVGGADFVKESSGMSFATMDDLIVYMHMNYSSSPGYLKAIAASLALYPDLEKNYEKAIKNAYAGK